MFFTTTLTLSRRVPQVFFVAVLVLLGLGSPLNAQADDDDLSDDQGPMPHVLYVETNDFHAGQNAILAYQISETDGSLALIGKFPTLGAGGDNFDSRLGPSDHDQEIIISPDQQFLFAINGGSNTIAVFRIHRSGRLTHVDGSPFPSGGLTPVSLGLAGDKLYVVNANNNNLQGVLPNNAPANYTGFHVHEDGSLEPIPGSTVEIAGDSNPTQANISPDNKYLFAIDLAGVPYQPQIVPFIPARGSLLHSFQIQDDGTLQEAPGGPFAPPATSRLVPFIPGTGYLLGLKAHPTQPILYAGEVITERLAVYTYDQNGTPSLFTDVPLPGSAICWFAFDRNVTRLFSAEAASNSVGVFDISNPLAPVHIQELQLRLLGANPPGPVPPNFFPTVDFQLALEPSGRWLYVVNRAETPNNDYPEGNVIHIMAVQPDGTLVEPDFSPVLLPVPPDVSPTGNAIR